MGCPQVAYGRSELPLPDPPLPEEEAFARQAELVGLTVPRRRSVDLRWVAVALTVVVVASAGIGAWTGWAVGPRNGAESSGVFGPQNCVDAPAPAQGP